ncbi:MAG: TetR/AcrR family transcriptional regulator [Reyranella sp.]
MPTALKPRKKPLQARSTVTVDAIVEATIRILRRDGWAACTTTRIATLAGVSVGSLYQYFPNRNAIAVEIVRRRTRTYLAAAIDADLSAAATPEETIDAAIEAFVTEKRKGLDVSLALRHALPEVQGRQAIIEEARRFVPALQAKLAAAGAGTTDAAQLAVAIAAVEGAVWEMMAQDEAAIGRPEAIAALSRVFRAAAGLSPAAAAR